MSKSDKVEIKMIAPLLWFYYRSENSATAMPFPLGHGFFIEKIDKNKEIKPLLEKARTLSEYEIGLVMDFSSYAIVKRYTVTRFEASHLFETKPYKEVEELKGLVKMGFGLAKGSNISFPTFHVQEGESSALVSSSYDERPPRWQYSGVQFGDEDLVTVRLLIEKIEPLASAEHNRIMNACIYFETGRLSHEYIVRYTILVSVLESLFNSSTDHISETIALRCSAMLTSDKEERLDYYRSLKDVYKMRSFLVHGQGVPKKFNSERQQKILIANAEFFARQSLLHIFRSNTEDVFKLEVNEFNEYFAKQLL
jgi:hypothetical protein